MIKDICIIFSVIIAFGIVWHLATLKYYSPPGLQLFLAQKRAGKSCLVAKNCLRSVKRGITTYCNCDDISIPNIRIFNVEDLGKYRVADAHLEIDEISLWYDNRSWKKNHEKNEEFVKLLRSAGHLGLTINMYSQDYSVDKRIRQLCDAIYIGKKYLRVITVWRRLKKEIAIKESAIDAESQIVDSINFTPWWMPGSIKITWIPRYVGYFDSFKDLYATQGALPFHLSSSGDEDERQ